MYILIEKKDGKKYYAAVMKQDGKKWLGTVGLENSRYAFDVKPEKVDEVIAWYKSRSWMADAKSIQAVERLESPSFKLECQECGRKFSRKGARTSYKCPKCGSWDIDIG